MLVEWHAGEGGVEACAWLEMLRRMHLKFCEHNGWLAEITSEAVDKVIRKSSAKIIGKGALIFFKTEHGVHKLTRISPFGNGKKHTSFVAVSVLNERKAVELSVPETDLRWDTFRGTGAGGQHRNKRDTAIRLTHLPTWTVVTVLSGRSQYQNKQNALKSLLEKLAAIEKSSIDKYVYKNIDRSDQGFGRHVRSYKLDKNIVKDELSNKVHRDPEKVLNGDLLWCKV